MIDWWTEFLDTNLPEPWMRALVILASCFAVGWIARVVMTRGVGRLARRSGSDLDDRLIRILAGPLLITGGLVGIYYGVRALEVGPSVALFVRRATQTIGLVIWVTTISRACRPVLDALARLADRVEWIQSRTVPLIENVSRIALFGLALYALLRIWNLDVAPWLASAGVVGLALGFAAKDSLANLFGGVFIIIDAPYQLGNYIVLESGERGEVTRIGLRSTRILTRDDLEITIPNAQIAAAKVINETGGRWPKSRVRVKVGVAYGSNVAHVRRVLLEAAQAVDYAQSDPEPRVRFRALGESSLDFELLVWIEDPVLRGRCLDALLTAVYERFMQEGISIPFPQRELHLAAPVRVVTAGE